MAISDKHIDLVAKIELLSSKVVQQNNPNLN